MDEKMVLMTQSDANDLDDVVRELGIAESFTTPTDAVRQLHAEITRLRQDLSTAIERAAKVAEETQDKTVTTFPEAWRKRPSEYQEDLRKAIASSIRSLASPTMGDET
jgi:hypothetical protein